jgi:type IV pilus assembly protein PilV
MSIKNERGFTLLEALIGFLILSIGMLGIASLQAVSLKAGKTSVYSSVALMKVDELLESMRANPSAVALAAYGTSGTGTGTGTNNSCSAAPCTDIQLAQDDVYWWKQNLKAGLPGAATTTVALAATGAAKMSAVTVTVTWRERDKSDTTNTTGVNKTYATTAYICTESPC